MAEIIGVVGPHFRRDADLAAEEGGAQFRNKFLARVAGIAEFLRPKSRSSRCFVPLQCVAHEGPSRSSSRGRVKASNGGIWITSRAGA